MFYFWGIRKKILFLVVTPTLLVSVVKSVYFVYDKVETLESTHITKGKTIFSSLVLLAESHSVDETEQLQQQLTAFRDSDSDILAIAVLDNSHQQLVNSGSKSFVDKLTTDVFPNSFVQTMSKEYFQMVKPLTLENSTQQFYLSIIINRQPIILEIYHTIFMASIITLSMLSICLYIALYLSRSLGTPLQQISEELVAINDGKLDIKLHTPEIPELAKISQTINSLANSLQLARENMQHNVDQATSDLTQTLETIEIQNIELDMARKQAVQASHVKSEFLANISHEIRTPMNGVIGFTNLLLNSKIDLTQKDYLLTIRKSANNLLSIIEDILDFSKIEAGKMTLDAISYSLRDCVEEVITILSPSAVKKNIELIPLIYKNVPEQLLGDPIRVKQILTNLVSNAIKFTEKGSIVVRVLLDDEDENSQLMRTTITDTGIGMTDEQISKLFKPFSQVNQRINRHHSGTGLGLVISKKLVEQMGGEINVESKSNEGTSFSFTLKSGRLSEKLKDKQPQISLPHQSVLLFDPHPMALLAMKQLLSSWDMKIDDFQNMDKLLAAIKKLSRKDNFNPLIMLGTSEQNQYMMDAILTLSEFDNIGIFILGHSTDQYEIRKFLQAGVNQYLEKPLTRKQLKKSFKEIGLLNNDIVIQEVNEQLKHQFSQLRILAVDDNPANLKLITIVLEEMSIDVIQAYDGLSAVEICKEERFDLIFMDIRMPGLDGIETSKRIRKDSLNQRTPIIALTAHAMTGEKEQLLANGLEDYITKPVSTLQLQQIISKWTGQIAQPTKESSQPLKLDSANSDMKSSIDWASCLHISGGRESLAREMLSDLVTAIPDFSEQIKACDNIDHHSQLLSVVHKLHGLACYTGVPVLQYLANKLEKQLKTDPKKAEIAALQLELIDELSKIDSAATSYLQVS